MLAASEGAVLANDEVDAPARDRIDDIDWVESYGSRIRDELLAIEQFDTLLEAQVLITDWRIDYNTYRPHSALGMLTPAEFADHWTQTNQPQLS